MRCGTRCISVHYRAPLNYSDDSLPAAAAAVERLDALLAALAAYREDRADDATLPAVLDGDAGRRSRPASTTTSTCPQALAALFDGVRELNRRIDARSLSTRRRRACGRLSSATSTRPRDRPAGGAALDPELQAMLDERVGRPGRAGLGGVGPAADELLAERGVAVEDTRDGQRWRASLVTIRMASTTGDLASTTKPPNRRSRHDCGARPRPAAAPGGRPAAPVGGAEVGRATRWPGRRPAGLRVPDVGPATRPRRRTGAAGGHGGRRRADRGLDRAPRPGPRPWEQDQRTGPRPGGTTAAPRRHDRRPHRRL